jgi:hypothetical protein
VFGGEEHGVSGDVEATLAQFGLDIRVVTEGREDASVRTAGIAGTGTTV